MEFTGTVAKTPLLAKFGSLGLLELTLTLNDTEAAEGTIPLTWKVKVAPFNNEVKVQ